MTAARLRGIWQRYRQDGALGLVRRASVSDTAIPRIAFFGTQHLLRLGRLNTSVFARALVRYELAEGQAAALDEIVRCLPCEERDRSKDVFASFFRDGSRCAVVRHEDDVVAFNWVFSRRYVLTYDGYRRKNVDLNLGDRGVCFGNGYIAEAYRLKGLFPHLLRFSMSLNSTATNFYSTVSFLNARSRASHLRMGFADVGDLACVSVLDHPLFFYRHRQDPHWRRLAGGRPLLWLDASGAASC